MDILDSARIVIHKNFLDIITILWIIWFSGVALGVVVSTVSSCRNRLTLARLGRRYEYARRRRGRQDAVQFELDPGRIKGSLRRREAELRQDAGRMKLDFAVQGVLENFQRRIRQRLADLPATRRELRVRLQKIYGGLEEFRDECGSDQVALARMALKRGAPGKAVALLQRAQFLCNRQMTGAASSPAAVERNRKMAASGAFLLGQLAEMDFNYFAATQYYHLAATFQPANPVYAGAAGELSDAFGGAHTAGELLEKVLNIQVKLRGPEDGGLAQTLHNIGVLRHTQGRHAEAEAFYLWALEVCETDQYPQDHDAANLRCNYAALLQGTGRHYAGDNALPAMA
jgi:tetratricopeptide (TPR) repeat protein